MLIGQRREFSFLLICFVKSAKLLAHDWSSGCQATAYSIEKLFICNDEFLVSKETVVLRRWERSKQKFGFIKRVDKG